LIVSIIYFQKSKQKERKKEREKERERERERFGPLNGAGIIDRVHNLFSKE